MTFWEFLDKHARGLGDGIFFLFLAACVFGPELVRAIRENPSGNDERESWE